MLTTLQLSNFFFYFFSLFVQDTYKNIIFVQTKSRTVFLKFNFTINSCVF